MKSTNESKLAKRASALAGRVVTGSCTCLTLAIFVCTANLTLVSTAFAYIDPGTGTMILQVVGALVASALFYLRNMRFWIAGKLGFGQASDTVVERTEGVTETKDETSDD